MSADAVARLQAAQAMLAIAGDNLRRAEQARQAAEAWLREAQAAADAAAVDLGRVVNPAPEPRQDAPGGG